MNPFKVHILGCGSARPTPRHCLSAQIVNYNNCLYAIDCGEGMQAQLARHHLMTGKLDRIFISHLHGDHVLGLPGLLSTMALSERTSPIHIYSPGGLESVMRPFIEFFVPAPSFDIIFHPFSTTQGATIFSNNTIEVQTVPLQHRVPCCGFIFREKQPLPHILRDMIDFYGIPNYAIKSIKEGADWVMPDGQGVPHARLTKPAEKARSYAYLSDTAYDPALAQAVEGVDLMYHEATYANDMLASASERGHSTTGQAAATARDAHARQLIIGHYSSRYDKDALEAMLLSECRAVFPNTVLANEGLTFDV